MLTKAILSSRLVGVTPEHIRQYKEFENKAEKYRELIIKLIEKDIKKFQPKVEDFDQVNYTFKRAWRDGQIAYAKQLIEILKEEE